MIHGLHAVDATWLISTQVFNGQLNPEKHVEAASAAVADLPKGGGGFDLASLLPF